mgnify:CR=1 FL=1
MKFLFGTEPDDTHALVVKLALEAAGHQVYNLFTADFPSYQSHSLAVDEHGWQMICNNGHKCTKCKVSGASGGTPRSPTRTEQQAQADVLFRMVQQGDHELDDEGLPIGRLTEALKQLNLVPAGPHRGRREHGAGGKTSGNPRRGRRTKQAPTSTIAT